MDKPASPDFQEDESTLTVDNMSIVISHFDGHITGITIITPLVNVSLWDGDITSDQGAAMLTTTAITLIQEFADENGLTWVYYPAEAEADA